MRTTIYFVRHGEVRNPLNLHYGRLSGFPLNSSGLLQAEKLARFFADKKIVAIYSSPQLRCRQTARPVRISYLIQELASSFDGIGKAEFEKIEPDLSNSKPLVNFIRESKEAIQRRMLIFVRKIVKLYPNQKVIVVSHGDPIVIVKAFLSDNNFDWNYKRLNYIGKGQFLKIVV